MFRSLLFAILLFTGSVASAARPNIVLIMADDFGYECLSCNGSTSYQTPNLDALAKGGIRFTNCYAQPLCTPTRVQLMTGIYNVRNYVRFGLLDPKATTFAQLLKKAGYATCVAGKWQLEGGLKGPNNFGFDEYCLWQLNRRPGRYPNPGLEVNGKQIDYNNGEYGPDLVVDYMVDFIGRHRDKPFLVYYPMMLTHSPFVPTPDSKEWDPRAKGEGRGKSKPKHFADMVAYADKMVARIVKQLDEVGVRENTLILFLGDNGTGKGITSMMGDRVVRGGKGMTTNAGTHVPFVASWPAVAPRGKVLDDLIDSTDFFPTLLEAAGAELPDDLKIDGRSFLPQLRGEKGNPREWVYCWYSRSGGPTGAEFARDKHYKLYRTGGLYDLDDDPLEQKDLSNAKLPADAEQARKKLADVLEQFKDARKIE